MTQEELTAAVNKLIAEANEESEKARRTMEEDCLEATYRAAENRTLASSALQEELEILQSDYDALVHKIQQELDESLEALYAENEPVDPEEPGEGIDPEDAPYEVDYSLPARDRYIAVKNYYLSYEDKGQALSDLEEDAVAQDYLGSYYSYLVQLLLLLQ